MTKTYKSHFYYFATLIALVEFSPSAWGMEYLSSWVDSEERIKSKVISALVDQMLPPSQNSEMVKTRSLQDLVEPDPLNSGMFFSIEQVDLEGKYIGNFGLNLLCTYAQCLHTLNLSYNGIEDKGCRYLLDLSGLTALNVSNNKIGNDGFKLLLQQPVLIKLEISNNYITLNNVSGDDFKNSSLSSLDLSWNLIEHEGAMTVAQSQYLTSLNLSNNKINNAGEVLLSLAKNTHLTSLSFSNPYDVSRTGKAFAKMGKAAGTVGRTGAVMSVIAITGTVVGLGLTGAGFLLADNIGASMLTDALNKATIWTILSGTTSSAVNGVVSAQVTIMKAGATLGAVGGIGAGTITGADVNKTLNKMESVESKIMRLGGKFTIGKEEAEALSQNTSLTALDLSDTCVTADIVGILTQSSSITSLNLNWNNLDDNDANMICSILKKSKNLTHIDLENNSIEDHNVLKSINALLFGNTVLK